MKLFSLPDGAIDEGERAQWFTIPFDLGLSEPVEPPEPEIPEPPESIDHLGPNFVIASRRIGWRRGGKMYPLRSYDNAQ